MRNRICFVGTVCFIILVATVASALAQAPYVPPTYPAYEYDSDDPPWWVTLENSYIQVNIGAEGNIKAYAFFGDGTTNGRGDKVPSSEKHDWHVAGRYGIVAKTGDPEVPEDNDRPLTFMGQEPCHYFGYWKLRIGNDMRMIGTDPGGWYSNGPGQPILTPTLYMAPPADLADKEPALGRMGPFIRGIWSTTGGNGSTVLTDIRAHLVRDMVRFEFRITNTGTVAESVGFEQMGDVETGDPVFRTSDDGGYYGPYDNACFGFVPGVGATRPLNEQSAMMFGGSEIIKGKLVPRPAVPAWVEYYDNVTSPLCAARNILNQEDATKPDYMAIGEYNDLYHRDLWIPTGYKPDPMHGILDMAWVLCWDQRPLAPGATRTIITYYGVGAATGRWTYAAGSTDVPDSAVAAVQAPRSLRYNSTGIMVGEPELMPSRFTVKAYVYNLATDPGPFDLTDVTATITLPPGLQLVDEAEVAGNTEHKEIGLVVGNSESLPVEWEVEATGHYSGELPIYVSFVDNNDLPASMQWQQTVVRKIYVPAVKRGVFHAGWQLMNVPFNFNDFRVQKVFGLVSGYGAKYWDPKRGNYQQVTQVKPGQGFWINVGINEWGATRLFTLDPANPAAIVGEAPGSGTQSVTQSIPLYKGWNMIGNPFVYPMYWGQALFSYKTTQGWQTVTLDAALRSRLLSATLFSYNPDKLAYDTTSSKEALLDPWKGYWVYIYQPCTLVLRAPTSPGGDVTANPGGQ